MSVLSHQAFANTDTPYWASASVPTALVSPLSVVDKYGVPTKKTTIEATSSGAGSIFVSNMDDSQFVGITLQQGATQPQNTIALDVGNVNPVFVASSSNVVSSVPIVLDSPTNPQNFTILPTPGGVELQQGTLVGSGSVISMTNGPGGIVGIMGASTFSQSSIVFADKFNNDTTINERQIQFGNAAGNVAQVGLTGSSAFLGTSTAPTTTPGVLVNISNGCELRFTDAAANVYGMKTTGGVLTISAPGDANAITMSSTGVVTIPNIVSGSFVPVGGIVMFSGSVGSLPANWKVCDGTFGTPDLRNRFIIGASPTYPMGDVSGSTIIGINNLPAHGHSITDVSHNHQFQQGSGGAQASGTFWNDVHNTYRLATTSNAFTGITKTTTTITSDNAGTPAPSVGQPFLPPYYALAYIMRMA